MTIIDWAKSAKNNDEVINYLNERSDNLDYKEAFNVEKTFMKALETDDLALLKKMIEHKNISLDHKFSGDKGFLHLASKFKD